MKAASRLDEVYVEIDSNIIKHGDRPDLVESLNKLKEILEKFEEEFNAIK